MSHHRLRARPQELWLCVGDLAEEGSIDNLQSSRGSEGRQCPSPFTPTLARHVGTSYGPNPSRSLRKRYSADKVQREHWVMRVERNLDDPCAATHHCSGHLDCHSSALRLHYCLEYPVCSRVEVQAQNTSQGTPESESQPCLFNQLSVPTHCRSQGCAH